MTDLHRKPPAQPNQGDEVALSDLQRDRDALVVDLPWTDRLSLRLRELGLLPGTRVRVLRTGSRLVIQIGEARLALRRADAAAIRVCDAT
ncbi:MAG: ferrous iron transport protein A [Candidatus Latescibacterota bacterium]|nr:ferrous iron transport protein A [Candidatus Latescibacterota bacterium]